MDKIVSETYLTAIGKLKISATSTAVVKIEFVDEFVNADNGNHLTNLAAFQINDYLLGKKVPFTVPYEIIGTEFQKQVWKAISEIPYGETRTYMDIAEKVGKKCTRAVGSACKANPLPIIIPCHRVIKSDGTVGAYNGGEVNKKKLLMIEKAKI
ncbi:MAG TPA: methylated-DNA--[protein]-cysteine S-methyltransferase [Clostridia bacterium]|jgi:O-6-methylguanine DNA methyltransferase|nr:methylated-DNA--[protein]-cysteine S-methyltransferase [Clostridia bacterium]